jgi:hypothetical protein
MKLTKSQLKEIIKEVISEQGITTWKAGTAYENDEELDEGSLDKVAIPGNVKKRMERFLNSMKDSKMSRIRQMHILLQVLKGLGIGSKDLMLYVQKVKQGLEKK